MKNIIYMSDPHLDFYVKPKKIGNERKMTKVMDSVVSKHLPVEGDYSGSIAVIAGDLGHYNAQTIYYLKALKKRVKHVVFTTGNHDMYLISEKQAKKYNYHSFNRTAELAELVKDIEGVHLLNGTTIDLDGTVFGGLPMWYNLKNKHQVENWINGMNDCRLIMEHKRPTVHYIGGWMGSSSVVTPTFNSVAFYKRQVAALATIKCDVLITHVCPSTIPDDARDSKYRNSPYNSFYESNTADLVASTGAKVCIFGHTHTLINFKEKGVDYVCNPFGYPSERLKQSYRRLHNDID